ncbi:MAG: long-chain-fatty-acid--CoA ligase [Gordonia sp. (in: high G+C Gram-positive bacteria)]|uniref:long-chain-fatty-acid--CoA ligase n=1 Tax=Gordonia sp. (in: high G+C Gram-positive bacteria) TaxID=84139 RepID=UPI003C709DBD
MSYSLVSGLPSTHGDDYPLNTTTLLRHAVRTYPEQEIVYRTADDAWDRYTYADAYRRIGQAANLLTGLGVEPADVVGILDWNSRRHFELYWAIPGTGAAMLQMNLRLAPEDLGHVARDSGASVVCVDESLIPAAEALAPHAPGVRTWIIMSDKPMSEISTTLPGALHYEELLADAGTDFDWPLIDERSTYSACYTSGTTGKPKGVYYSHRGIYLHSLTQVAEMGISSADTVMLITPMFHGQSWGLPQSAVAAKAKVVLPGRYMAEDTSVLVNAMIAEEVTVANGAPAIFQPMLDYIRTLPVKPDLSRTRLLSGATEPSLSLMRGLFEETGADVIHAYGATETTPFVTVNRLKPGLRSTMPTDDQWDLRRCQGLPVTGVDLRIVDADGNDLPADGVSQGEIVIRGPWIIQSYHNLDNDDDRFLDGWWRSGDVGHLDTNGYLKLTDRIKDVIKSGGEWISSIDMENALTAHPQIADAAVIGAPHPKWQERPVALVVTTDARELPLSEVHDVLAGQFAKWQLPEVVIYVDSLPRTGVGKLDKKVLRSEYADTYQGENK